MRQPCRRGETRAEAGHSNFRAHMGADSLFAGERMKASRAVDSITIQ